MAFATHLDPDRWGGEFTTSCTDCGFELRRDRDPAAAERVVNRPCQVCGTKPPRHRPGPRTPSDDLEHARTRIRSDWQVRPARPGRDVREEADRAR
jgi:hypothetical protein